MKHKRKGSKLQRVLDAQRPSKSDPDGSYTGIPMDPREAPVQDADDK